MRFSELLAAAGLVSREVHGDADVMDVVADSRRCRAGCCFVAVRGTTQDAHRYIAEAISGGASAVVCQDAACVPNGTAWAAVEDTRQAVGVLAQAFRGWPARKLTCIGVTGTNGKSTTVHLIRAILQAAGLSPALLGTIAYETGRRVLPAGTTTPDPISLAQLVAEMVAEGRTHLVMEVSSHALDQQRVAGLEFRVAVFTNLTGDHLDYHGSMDRYLLAKQRLFDSLSPDAAAVINRDDPAGEMVAARTPAALTWYGLSPAADFRARIDRIDAAGTDFTLQAADQSTAVHTPLIGRHNVYNCLAAAAACWRMGIDLATAARGVAAVPRVRGRLERVPVEAPFQVFVDYAHTDDALKNVLSALRPLVGQGRILTVFGCGGDRDRTKRPRMAREAERLSDLLVVTSDNPRSERPEAIIEEIVAGLSPEGRGRTTVEPDRRAAIELAVGRARPGDIVLIAGKGHEDYQILGDRRIHFDDVEVASEAMRKLVSSQCGR